jgi:hypothetical protein
VGQGQGLTANTMCSAVIPSVILWVFWGFSSGVAQDSGLVRCDASSPGQRISTLEGSCRHHLQGTCTVTQRNISEDRNLVTRIQLYAGL